MYRLESRLISLFDRTFKKGISGSQLQRSVKMQFSSSTFKKQLDKIIDDLYIYTVSSTDKLINKSLSAGLTSACVSNFLSAADTNTQEDDESLTEEALYLALTLEAVNECEDISQTIAQTIENDLKKESAPRDKTTQKIVDLWNKYKYKAEQWVKNISVDVANNIAVNRYQQYDIEYCQFVAIIDNRTSPQCRVLNGTIFKCDSKEVQRFRPPLHPYCRSAILPITDSKKVANLLKFENRDFANPIGNNLRQTGESFNSTKLKKIFDDVDKYKGNYKIEQKVLDKDIEQRFKKLNIDMKSKPKIGHIDDVPKQKVELKPRQNKAEIPTKKEVKLKDVKKKPLDTQRPENNAETIIQNYEKTIKGKKTENGLLFSKNGKLLIEKEGTENTIHFTETEKKRFRGKIFTHNHPGVSSSFSLADVHVACEYGLNEIRATTKDGTFIMKMANGSNFNKKIYNEKIQDVFEKHRKFQAILHNNRMRNEISKGKVTEEESIAWATKVIWNNTSKEIPELKYEFIRWD